MDWAYKDRTIKLNDETPGSHEHNQTGATGPPGTHGEQNTHKTVHNADSPTLKKFVPTIPCFS